MKLLNSLMVVIWTLLITGCSYVSTQVDAYSSIPEDIDPRTVYLAPFKGMNIHDLEWQSNTQALAAVLKEKGFDVVGHQRDARLTAYFGFHVNQGELVQNSYSIPEFGITGYSKSNTYGKINGKSYSASTTFTPDYGVTGHSTGLATSIVFTRDVAINMVDNRTRKTVFKAHGVSRGSCHSFAPVAISIIRAVLSNFPEGTNGTVDIPMENRC